MREILFRGQDYIGDWHIGSIVHKVCENDTATNYYAKSGMCNHIINIGDYYIIDENGEGFWVSPETIGQYTGLTDKNGVKIFEGDIVVGKIGYCGSPNLPIKEIKFEVKYRNGCYNELHCIDYYEFEVIGNIHNNPELLKDGE